MRGFPQHPDLKRNRTAVRVPHHTTGRLRQKHPDPAAAQSPLRCQPRRATFASRLFIGNQRQRNSPVQFGAALLERENGVEHGHNPALHVAGSPAKQEMVFPPRLELLFGLRWDHIVMPMKIENALSPPVAGNQADGLLAGTFSWLIRLQLLAIEATLS